MELENSKFGRIESCMAHSSTQFLNGRGARVAKSSASGIGTGFFQRKQVANFRFDYSTALPALETRKSKDRTKLNDILLTFRSYNCAICSTYTGISLVPGCYAAKLRTSIVSWRRRTGTGGLRHELADCQLANFTVADLCPMNE